MLSPEFESVSILRECSPSSGPFAHTQFTAAGSYTFESLSGGSIRIMLPKSAPGKFLQLGPGQWWAVGKMAEQTEIKKNR